MRTSINLFVLAMALSGAVFAQTATVPKVTMLTMPADPVAGGEVTGNLKDGQIIPLRWAESSQVACFPGTRFEMFNGNHVLYRVTLPAASSMVVTVTPKNNSAINLYALRQGSRPTDQSVPPNVERAISCEASYPIYANLTSGKVVKNKETGIRKVEYISVNSPYSILIGVAGANGLTEGDFTLNISIKPR
jgi:hypothetical protein